MAHPQEAERGPAALLQFACAHLCNMGPAAAGIEGPFAAPIAFAASLAAAHGDLSAWLRAAHVRH